MPRLLSILILMLSILHSRAQEFEPLSWQPVPRQWIAQPGGDGCQDVWFCKNYSFSEKPYEARLQIATAGWVEVFVNGRNVDHAVLVPAKTRNADEMAVFEYDIRRFMRRGTNSIAINYSPRRVHSDHAGGFCTICSTEFFDHAMTGTGLDSLSIMEWNARKERRRHDILAAALAEPVGQISIKFYGENTDDTLFEAWADRSWLCRSGRRCLTADGGEMLDGRKKDFRNGFDGTCAMLWTPVIETNKIPMKWAVSDKKAYSIGNIFAPRYKRSKGDSFFYEFTPAYYGFVRLTLRRCKNGDHLRIGNFRYICNGTFDEQAYGKFAPQIVRECQITGPATFSRDNINTIEGLSLVQF